MVLVRVDGACQSFLRKYRRQEEGFIIHKNSAFAGDYVFMRLQDCLNLFIHFAQVALMLMQGDGAWEAFFTELAGKGSGYAVVLYHFIVGDQID